MSMNASMQNEDSNKVPGRNVWYLYVGIGEGGCFVPAAAMLVLCTPELQSRLQPKQKFASTAPP